MNSTTLFSFKPFYLFGASIVIFIISLTIPAFYCENHQKFIGGELLLNGSYAFILGGVYSTWLANPFLILSWILFRFSKIAALVTSVIAISYSLSFMHFRFEKIIINEGNTATITDYAAGYWLWVASMFLIAAANIQALGIAYIDYRREKNNWKTI